jgi:hypothetical protein
MDSNAPSDPFLNAPTENLHRVAGALRLRNKSVSTRVTVPGGLNIGNPMEISILFGTQRVTQTYTNSGGNQFLVNFPARDGGKRRENVTISLWRPPPPATRPTPLRGGWTSNRSTTSP